MKDIDAAGYDADGALQWQLRELLTRKSYGVETAWIESPGANVYVRKKNLPFGDPIGAVFGRAQDGARETTILFSNIPCLEIVTVDFHADIPGAPDLPEHPGKITPLRQIRQPWERFISTVYTQPEIKGVYMDQLTDSRLIGWCEEQGWGLIQNPNEQQRCYYNPLPAVLKPPRNALPAGSH
jgi:hypothetical protein